MSGAINEEAAVPLTFSFFKGGVDVLLAKPGEQFSWERAAAKVREQLADALNAQNLSFLFGSGASSILRNNVEMGVPTMRPLAREFVNTIGTTGDALFPTAHERKLLLDVGVDLNSPSFAANLERLMEVLLSLRFTVEHSAKAKPAHKTILDLIIQKAVKFVRTRCTEGAFSAGDETVLNLYKTFYKKLVYRERTRSRPWIFTTNYDLFNETAMDRLGIPYANGFLGSVERRFNPSSYRYSLAEQLDISSQKWSAVDGFVHLCKLHGSVNWIEDGKGFFRVREAHISENLDAERVMIYPTPGKQNASFGSPYVDLFREFQMKVVREQSVLFVIGYSFGDEHINNLIFQALTIPSFRMVLLASPAADGVVQKLREVADPRIWIIGGDGPSAATKAHYFDTFVEHFMPHLPGDRVDTALDRIISTFAKAGPSDASEADAE